MAAPSTTEQDLLPDDAFADSRRRVSTWGWLYTFPWWGLALILLGIWIAGGIAADEIYSGIFDKLIPGIAMTLRVAGTAYFVAFMIGLMVGAVRSSPPKPRYGLGGRILSFLHVLVYNVATFFVMVMRGLPILIVLLFFAFVVVPALRNYLADNMGLQLGLRGSSAESAIIALAFTYGAYMSETIRAGIQSIDKGQIEASRSLGMTYLKTMRYIVLPQALRRVLPPLGNDFVAMIKDSSLVAILGVNDLTQLAKLTSGANFRYLETYSTVAMIYLTMTILGALLVRYVEGRISIDE